MLEATVVGSQSLISGCESDSTVWCPTCIDLDATHSYHDPWSTSEWIDRNIAEVNDEPPLHGDAGAIAAELGMSAAQSFVREQ